jgi:serine/threonine protein kinase
VLIGSTKPIALKAVSKRATLAAARDAGAALAEADLLYGEGAVLRALGASRHRNMLRFHGQWEDAEHVYLGLQLCMGGELADWVGRQPAYTEAVAAKAVYDVLQALTHAHGLGVVHRDVKPANVLFSSTAPDAYLKLADWGLAARWAPGGPPLTEHCGTLEYTAPEMAAGEYDARADVWSAGVLLLLLLTGKNALRGPSAEATRFRCAAARARRARRRAVRRRARVAARRRRAAHRPRPPRRVQDPGRPT